MCGDSGVHGEREWTECEASGVGAEAATYGGGSGGQSDTPTCTYNFHAIKSVNNLVPV